MAEIICMECKASVSDASGSCPECGYPFDNEQAGQSGVSADEPNSAQPNTIVTTPLDIIVRSLNSVGQEIKELQSRVTEIRQDLDSRSASAADNSQKILAEIRVALDTIASAKKTEGEDTQSDDPKKTKKELLAAFYKTLNSPNSMFEYMFYICVVQIIFVIVNLFLVAYIVTLVR